MTSDAQKTRAQKPCHAPRVWRHANGFTLIELILVLALLVIITSMALPTMSRFIRGRALGSESARLLALMHEAQSRAVSEGMPVILWIDAPHGQYGVTLETTGQAGDAKAENLSVDDTLKIAVMNLGTGTQTTFKSMPAIRFLPDGTIDEGSPQTVQLADGDGFTQILTEMRNRTGYENSDRK